MESTSSLPLQGLRVLEIGDNAQVCGKVLACLGADVIKIESPVGSLKRNEYPFVSGKDGTKESLAFFYFNVNKRSITLSLDKESDLLAFKELVRQADVVLDGMEAEEVNKLGLDYPSLKTLNPRLVVTSVSGFGRFGPYSHFRAPDIVCQAMSGHSVL